jgi:transcriptional regulator with XRE-family HTH domain
MIGKQTRAMRQALGWSQDALAERADVSRPTVARVERGDDVSTTTVEKLAMAMGVTLALTHKEPCPACEVMRETKEPHAAIVEVGAQRVVVSMGKRSDEQDYTCTICGKAWMLETGDSGD